MAPTSHFLLLQHNVIFLFKLFAVSSKYVFEFQPVDTISNIVT